MAPRTERVTGSSTDRGLAKSELRLGGLAKAEPGLSGALRAGASFTPMRMLEQLARVSDQRARQQDAVKRVRVRTTGVAGAGRERQR